ncbi:hypothetical protein ACTD5D_40615 [Nocardia takedensis]|uniref:hypothetical protein n=1 Tax=Nocardia takedensis TaxID=259390 RepID=UPI003F762197
MTTVAHNSGVAQPDSPQSHSLMPLLGPAHLYRAARICMRRGSVPGADGVSWAGYRRRLKANLAELDEALRAGTWRPGPLRTVPIELYTGKPFTLYIPTVGDRIVHRAMRTAIEPILEADAFADWVSGFRPGRNRIDAVRTAAAHIAQDRCAVADIDVREVSAGSSAGEVTDWLAEYVHDGSFLSRFRTALLGMGEPIAPGSGLAPLLINLRLSRVDRRLSGLRLVRFADNYCAFTSDDATATDAYRRIADALAAEGLDPNPAKSRVRTRANPEDLFLLAG